MASSDAFSPLERALILLLALLVVALYAYQILLFWGQINDDAYITYRYSLHLAEGQGPVYNLGERVEGYTNFLLMLVLGVVGWWIGTDAMPLASLLLGVISGLLVLAASVWLMRGLTALLNPDGTALPDRLGWLAGVAVAGLIAASPAFALNATTGLETALYSMLLTSACAATLHELRSGRWVGSGVLWALLVLTRPEGMALWGICVGGLFVWHHPLWQRVLGLKSRLNSLTPAFLINLSLVLLILIGHFLFRWYFYDGEWLPNTYWAKQGGFAKHPPLDYAWNGVMRYPLFGWMGLGAAALGYLVGWRRYSGPLLNLQLLALFCFALPAIAGSDWMLGWRLVIPYLPLLTVVLVLGWVLLLARLGAPAQLLLLMPALLIVASWMVQSPVRGALVDSVQTNRQGYLSGHGALAHWLADHSQAGDAIALMDIGMIGFGNPQLRVIDISGLTDRVIGKSPGRFLAKDYDPAYVLAQRPRYVIFLFPILPEKGTEDVRANSALVVEPQLLAEDRLYRATMFRQSYLINPVPAEVQRKIRIEDFDQWRPNRASLEGFAHGFGAVTGFYHRNGFGGFLMLVFERQIE